MTDRELVTAAAKAIGWRMSGYSESGTSIVPGGTAMIVADGRVFGWRPLTDDGDALRLAVRLSMTIAIDCEDKTVAAVWYTGKLAEERFTDQASALVAARRAIVRCAAEAEKVIGRAALGETKREG